jgi:DNA repair photolyase
MLAADAAPVVGQRGETEYLDLPCRSALNRCTSDRMPFRWTINPYRGCEFGCTYCYARYTHEFMGMDDSRLFETRIFAKQGAAEALERDLPPGKIPDGAIAIGTVTDPYQPVERKLKVTRSILEVLARREGLTLSITTKGALITRDIDLLLEIARRNTLTINITITTLSRKLSRMLEGRAPRPAKRLEALRSLTSAGLRAGVFIMPVIPAITDGAAALEAIVAAASRAGASYVACQALFLRSSARKEFYPFLDASFPKLAPRLKRIYGANVYYTSDYRERLSVLFRKLQVKYGFAPRSGRWDPGASSNGERRLRRTGGGAGAAGGASRASRSRTVTHLIDRLQMPLAF